MPTLTEELARAAVTRAIEKAYDYELSAPPDITLTPYRTGYRWYLEIPGTYYTDSGSVYLRAGRKTPTVHFFRM